MPLQSITAPPSRNTTPSLVIDTGATDPVQLRGAGRRIRHAVNQTYDDVETFDNPGGEAPSIAPKSLIVDILQSFGAQGSYNLLLPLQGSLVDFSYLIDATAANADANPEYSGQLYVPEIPIVDAGVRKFTTFSLDFKISGTPAINVSGTLVYADHA